MLPKDLKVGFLDEFYTFLGSVPSLINKQHYNLVWGKYNI